MKFLLLLLFSANIYAQEKCVLYYPKECSPKIFKKEMKLKCEKEYRKIKVDMEIWTVIRDVYLPENIKMVEHKEKYFLWKCE